MDSKMVFLIFAIMAIIIPARSDYYRNNNNKDVEPQVSKPPLKSAMKKGQNDPTKPKKRIKLGFVEYKGFTEECGLNNKPPVRDYSIFGNVDPRPDIEIQLPESPKSNIQYQESTIKVQPNTDRLIYQKKAPKQKKRFNLFNVCLSEPKTD